MKILKLLSSCTIIVLLVLLASDIRSQNVTTLPGGRRIDNGTFNYIGHNGFGWSSTDYDSPYAYSYHLANDFAYSSRSGLGKRSGVLLRWVKG